MHALGTGRVSVAEPRESSAGTFGAQPEKGGGRRHSRVTIRRVRSAIGEAEAMGHSIARTRRNFIRTSTAVAATVLVGGPVRRSGLVPAAAQTSGPPTVDRLAVRVVVDSYQDALVRSGRVGAVEVERFGTVFGPGLGKQIF